VKRALLFFELLCRLFVLELRLRFEPVRDVVAFASRSKAWIQGDPEWYYRAVLALTGRLYGRSGCLPASLLFFSIAPSGARLKIGFDRTRGAEAHAWVEWKGRAYSTQRDLGAYNELLTTEKGSELNPQL
jgi:hypothetical protein